MPAGPSESGGSLSQPSPHESPSDFGWRSPTEEEERVWKNSIQTWGVRAMVRHKNELRLMGIAEIAEALNQKRGTVSQWHRRGKLPPPDTTLKMGAVWRAETIENWRKG